MSTSGELISRAVREASTEITKTLNRGIHVLEQAGLAVGHLALSTDNLAQEMRRAREGGSAGTDEDGEPVRQPFTAWPRARMTVPADREVTR